MAGAGASVALSDLFAEFPLPYSPENLADTAVTGIAIDSRKVEPGFLFIARRGESVDGHTFIPAAIGRGAGAIVGEEDMSGLAVPYIRVQNSIQAVTWLAAAFHGWPGRKLTVIGVTGTDGKTTTCNLLYQVMVEAGMRVGLISTVNAVIGNEVVDTGFHVTTPDAQDVQAYLARMVQAGATHVILETTSHGLEQQRVDAALFDVAVFTNITHEHLDQHGSFEKYRAAKGRLLSLVGNTPSKSHATRRVAVLNRDDPSYDTLVDICGGAGAVQIASYGIIELATITARNIRHLPDGLQFDIVSENFTASVRSPLLGEFNVSNCLAAFTAAVVGLGIDPVLAAEGLGTMKGIAGRMERIDLGQPFTAIVDFAHTPNALRVALETARKMTQGRVIAVFGSAGLRDREKRRMMAEVSTKLADISVFTAEDPRSESLEGILEEMAQGALLAPSASTGDGTSKDRRMAEEGRTFFRIADRGEAIRFGVRSAQPGDVVLACGKGHEQSMCIGEVEYAWDDRQAMRAALAELRHVPGPEMPFLPTQEAGNG